MRLMERYHIDESGFYVKRDPAFSERRIFYRMFPLTDGGQIEETKLQEMNYLTSVADASEATVKLKEYPERAVLIVEKDSDGQIVDSARFYYNRDHIKNNLWFSIKKRRRYGSNAYVITIRWERYKAEDISSSYIYLVDREGNRYYFLREVISAEDPTAKKPADRFVFELPGGQNIGDYRVETDPLLEEKYDIIME